MKKMLAVLALVLGIFIFTPVAFAQENFRAEEVSTLSKDETIDSNYFASGEKVTVSGTVNGDAYVAGGNIVVDGTINGDLLVAGGNVSVEGIVAGDVRIAGGNLDITGTVGGNVTAVGGNTQIAKTAQIAGSFVGAGGNIEIFGPVAKGITVGAGELTVSSAIGADSLTAVEELSLASGADIKGDLTYISNNDATIAKGATVSGQIIKKMPPVEKRAEGARHGFAGAKAGWSIYSFIVSFILGTILILALPVFTKKAALIVQKRLWVALGVGAMLVFLIPIVAIVLMATFVGIPFGVLLMVAYVFILLFIAKIVTSIALGEWVLEKAGQKENQIAALFIGLLLLGALGIIPIVGGITSLASTLVGVGAYALAKRETFLHLRSKKII